MKNKKYIIAILVLIAVVILGIKGKTLLTDRKSQIENEPTPEHQSLSIKLVKPEISHLRNTVPFLAQVASDKSITLSTKLAGYVRKVFVEEAQTVKKGEMLVKIDAEEIQSNIEALKATLRVQKNDIAMVKSIHARNQKLYRVGGLSKEKLDMSSLTLSMKKSVYENTNQKILQLMHQLDYLDIKAPFDGQIDALMLHEGDLAATGKPILSMSNGEKKLIFSFAPTKDLHVRKAQKVLHEGKEIGMIKSIYTTSKNGLVEAEIILSKSIDLPIGSSINIALLTKEGEGCVIPSNTLLHKKNGVYIMVYDGKNFNQQKIKIVMSGENKILVEPCPKNSVAQGSESKLSSLSAYKNVHIVGEAR